MPATQRDIAREAGVSLATVSRVLRNHPGVTPTTREKVLKAVRQTGYCHNPLVDAWAANFRESHRRAGLVIGHIIGFSQSELNARPDLRTLCEGVRERASEIGASVDTFHLGPDGELSDQRLQQILQGRGITALINGPFPQSAPEPSLQWKHFAVIAMRESPATRRFHRVVHNRYTTLRKALFHLLESGYERPGLVGFGPAGSDASRDWLAAYLQIRTLLPEKDRIPWLPLEHRDDPSFDAWWRKHRPDVVLSPIPGLAHRMGPPAPTETNAAGAFFGLDMHESMPAPALGGTVHPHREIGRGAVDLLVAQTDYFETGLPDFPRKVAFLGRGVGPGPGAA